jgi:hypothetical protein
MRTEKRSVKTKVVGSKTFEKIFREGQVIGPSHSY